MFFSVCFPKLLNMSLTASVVIVFVLLLRFLLKKHQKSSLMPYGGWFSSAFSVRFRWNPDSRCLA